MRRLLFVSNLFPDVDQPIRGLDNASILHAMRADWDIRVLSPRATLKPWQSHHLKAREQDEIFSPRYVNVPYLPRIGSWCNDHFMELFLADAFARVIMDFKPDAVLCSWLYPDGCAVARLARRHGIPIVLVTQGSDTHGYLKFPVRRRKIVSAIENSAAVICRSGNLAHRLREAGAENDKLKVIYNGVDTDIFQIRSRDEIRRELNLPPAQPVLLFVGNYLPVKNPLLLIRAHAELNRRRDQRALPLVRLVLIGDGPMRAMMELAIKDEGSGNAVELRAREMPSVVSRWMNAADLLCLSSHNEGFPNVILEAMASGLRVISTDVGGISELISQAERGILVPSDDLDAYVDSLERALSSKHSAPDCEGHGGDSAWSWNKTARSYSVVLESTLSNP